MAAALQPIDKLISARWVIPVNGSGSVLDHHSIAVNCGRIVAILPTHQATAQFDAKQQISCPEHVLTPGFINAHGHSAMALFRGMADDKPLHSWLEQDIWPAEGKWVSEQFVRDGARLAMLEMLLGGTTCFSDMYFFPNIVAAEAAKAGLRAQLAFPVLDFPTAWASGPDEYLAKGTALYDQFRHSPLISIAFGLHAIYTVSEPNLVKASTLINELDAAVQMHLHETEQEIQIALHTNGERPLATLQRLGLITPRLQAVHACNLNAADIDLLVDNGSHVIHCPHSNLKLASGFCPVYELQRRRVNVALGTDGAASNNSLDMANEMSSAARLAKSVSSNASALPAAQALAMATINGAKALGIDSVTGSLEPGKQADIVAHDLSSVRHQPVYNPLSQLVYTNDSNRVQHVWVAGEQLVRDRKATSLPQAAIIHAANDWRARISP